MPENFIYLKVKLPSAKGEEKLSFAIPGSIAGAMKEIVNRQSNRGKLI